MIRNTISLFFTCCLSAMLPITGSASENKDLGDLREEEEIRTMLDYYRTQSTWTDPGANLPMYQGIPDAIPNVVQAVQNVVVHGGLLWLYKMNPTEQQNGGFYIRKAEEILGRIGQLKPGSLTVPRSENERLVVNCRQFAVLTCSILRSKGIPARVRAGYALYTWGRGKYENHWICEYWHPTQLRWVQVDAQIDAAQRKLMGIDFNTLDMPPGQFISAGEGWERYRQGKVNIESFGLGGKGGWNGIGWGMVMPNVVCDAMALNKDEFLPWDIPPYWTKRQDEMSAEDMDLIEKLATAPWSQSRSFYTAHRTLHMPADFEMNKP